MEPEAVNPAETQEPRGRELADIDDASADVELDDEMFDEPMGGVKWTRKR